LADFVEVK